LYQSVVVARLVDDPIPAQAIIRRGSPGRSNLRPNIGRTTTAPFFEIQDEMKTYASPCLPAAKSAQSDTN
jgi:hypothetical protein